MFSTLPPLGLLYFCQCQTTHRGRSHYRLVNLLFLSHCYISVTNHHMSPPTPPYLQTVLYLYCALFIASDGF